MGKNTISLFEDKPKSDTISFSVFKLSVLFDELYLQFLFAHVSF